MFNVAVIESDPALRSQLIADLGERVRAAAFPTIESLEERLEDGTPVVALLGPSCADSAGLIAVERLTRSRPEVGTVLMVDALSTDVLQRALRAGVKDVLAAPVPAGRARPRGRAGRSERSLRSRRPRSRPRRPEPRPDTGRVITVFSTKGGAGKSVIAANLAVSLARRARAAGRARRRRPAVRRRRRDAQAGAAAHDRRRRQLARPARRRAAAEPARRATSRRACSCCRPRSSRRSPTRSAPPRWSASSRCCARSARYVVIDTPAYFNDVVLGLIEVSDDVLLVAGHGHPEHQEREDRAADAAAAEHADVEAAPRPQPGQLQGEARRRRGRAHAADQGRRR